MMYKIQLGTIIITAVFFVFGMSFFAGISAIYGGVVSLVNSVFWARHTAKQKQKLASNANASIRMMIQSVVVRVTAVAVLVLFGLLGLKLYPIGLLSGLAAGQIGFILDLLLGKKDHGIR